jgi:3-hydroxyisobutyrate dehydrogenase-like beta-hydroxyacid dehydrogenase
LTQKIGFVGLGQMGKWMALNMLKAGYDLTVCDTNPHPVEELCGAGAAAAASPSKVAEETEWVFLSLPNSDVVERVIFGPEGWLEHASPRMIVIDLGTTGYMPTIEFARRLKEHNISFIDAPVSGMEERAKTGELTVMVGGEEAIYNQILPVLKVIGKKILHMGQLGSGQLSKLINQILFNISCAAVAEVLPMAAKLGLDPEKVTEVITNGTGRSFAAEFFVPRALDNIFEEGYPLKAAYKDMISAFEISAQMKIPLPLTHAAATTYQMALAEGYGDLSKGAMIKVFEKMLGVEFRKRRSG